MSGGIIYLNTTSLLLQLMGIKNSDSNKKTQVNKIINDKNTCESYYLFIRLLKEVLFIVFKYSRFLPELEKV